MNKSVVTVMLVDDHAVVRSGYRRLLEETSGMSVVAEANTGEQACELERQHFPDVIVVDLSLPGMSGLEVIRRLRARGCTAKILVFTMHESPVLAERALKTGADGYVTKHSAPDVLVRAIERIAAGHVYIGPATAQELAIRKVRDVEQDPLLALPSRQFEILRLIAEGHTKKEIANTLHLSVKTVTNYVTQIKKKMGVTETSELVRLAIRAGISAT